MAHAASRARLLRLSRMMASARESGSKGWWPELRHLVLWLGCLLALFVWLREEMSLVDGIIFVGAHVACFPVLFPATTPRILCCLAGLLHGIASGLQVIDMCFDLMILNGQPISDGTEVYQPEKIAYLYYSTVINASHVNAVLLVIVLVSFMGSVVGFSRASAVLRRQWLWLGLWMVVGTSGYLINVVPRYLAIRSSQTFDPALFVHWEVVIASRLVLFASIFLSTPVLFKLQGIRDERGKIQPMGAKTVDE